MIEDQVRALFTGIADGEPTSSRVDTGLAHRRGRARLRWRRAGLAGAPVLAAAAVAAVVLAVGVAPLRPGPGPAPTEAGAPRQFNPLVPYAAFGWLPPGYPVLLGGSSRSLALQLAGPSVVKRPWMLDVAAAGSCRLAPEARELTCRSSPLNPGQTWRITAKAPTVHGHRAFWARSRHVNQGYLVWEYARGGWAVLTKVGPDQPGPARRALAVKIADHVRYGTHAVPPLAFPAQLTGVPAAWQLSSVLYVPSGAVSRANGYAFSAGPAVTYPSDQTQSGLPALRLDPAGAHSSCPSLPHSVHEVIAGHRVIVGHITEGQGMPGQSLCAASADGLRVTIVVAGRHQVLSVVSLFAHHLHLLGTNPAHWARNPIG
jgi:hypothetical protein